MGPARVGFCRSGGRRDCGASAHDNARRHRTAVFAAAAAPAWARTASVSVGAPAGANAAVTLPRREFHAPYSPLPPLLQNRRRPKPSVEAPGTQHASSTESARPRGRGGGGQLQERRGGGRRGGNKATHVRGAQRRVCVAAPAASAAEGSPERRQGPRRQAAPTTPAPRPDQRPARPESRRIGVPPDWSCADRELRRPGVPPDRPRTPSPSIRTPR